MCQHAVNPLMDVSDHTVERDAEWQKQTDVIITPDPRLSSAQQDVVAQDYDMTEGQLVLHVRAKLLPYVIKFLQIDLNVREQNPRHNNSSSRISKNCSISFSGQTNCPLCLCRSHLLSLARRPVYSPQALAHQRARQSRLLPGEQVAVNTLLSLQSRCFWHSLDHSIVLRSVQHTRLNIVMPLQMKCPVTAAEQPGPSQDTAPQLDSRYFTSSNR